MNIMRLIALSLLFSFTSQANAASVEKLSLEKFIDTSSPYWQVEANCSGSDIPRAMKRPIDSDTWCSIDNNTSCDKNKYSLSRKLCDDSFNGKISNSLADSNKVQPSKIKIDDSRKVSNIPITKPDQLSKSINKAAVANKTPSIAPVSNGNITREELLIEQVQIEEQRILIDQKKLELRRKELELQKSRLNTN